jgi:hypothetical protein
MSEKRDDGASEIDPIAVSLFIAPGKLPTSVFFI